MRHSNSLLKKLIQKIKLTLFCMNNKLKSIDDETKKAWKKRIARIIGKVLWIIIDKLADLLF